MLDIWLNSAVCISSHRAEQLVSHLFSTPRLRLHVHSFRCRHPLIGYRGCSPRGEELVGQSLLCRGRLNKDERNMSQEDHLKRKTNVINESENKTVCWCSGFKVNIVNKTCNWWTVIFSSIFRAKHNHIWKEIKLEVDFVICPHWPVSLPREVLSENQLFLCIRSVLLLSVCWKSNTFVIVVLANK